MWQLCLNRFVCVFVCVRACVFARLPLQRPWPSSSSKLLAINRHRMTLEGFLPSSPDLNVIEAWWRRLRQRLETNAPDGFENRSGLCKALAQHSALD